MSDSFKKVIELAINDATFRQELRSNPDSALRGFELSKDELAALRSRDAGKLQSLGVDQRASMALVADNAVDGAASRATSDGSLSVGGMRVADGDPGAGIPKIRDIDPVTVGTVLISDPTAASDALEDRSHAFAATRSADLEPSTPSAVRDIAPSELQGSGLVAPVEGSPEAFAFENAASAPTSDQLEDISHSIAQNAYLSSEEATNYAGANWSADQAEDIAHTFNPAEPTSDATEIIDNTGTNDPQISA